MLWVKFCSGRLGSIQILRDPLRGRGGVTKKITKDHMGEGGFTKRSQRITITRKGGGMQKKLGQTKGSYNENNYSQD